MNKKLRIVLVLMLSLILSFSLFSCGDKAVEEKKDETQTEVKKETTENKEENKEESKEENKEESSYTPIEIKRNLDGKDYTFKFEKSPERVLSMSQATTEMFLALGLRDKMVGTAFLEEEIYPPLADDYNKVKVVAEKWPSYEEFMSVKPDFTTGWAVPFTKRAIPAEKIVNNDIVIYVPNSMLSADATLETLFEDFVEIGKIFDNEEFVNKYVAEQREKLEAIKAKLKDHKEKRVFLYDSEDDQPFTVFEGYTTHLFELINAKNVMSGKGSGKTWGKASWESVVEADPEYILVIDYGVSIRNTDDFDQKVEKIKSNPALKNIAAVKNNNFIRVKLSEITPGVRSVDSLERLSETIHQEKEEMSYTPVEIKRNLDGKDYTFKFEKSPERVLSMSQATTEMFLALGLRDKMVGTAFLEEEIYPPLADDYNKVKVVAEKWPSYEEFMAVKPDFTTGWAVPFTKRAIPAEKIVNNDIAIYVPNSMLSADATLETLFEDFVEIGKIFDNEEFVNKYVAEQKAKLEAIKAKLKDHKEKRVFLYDSEDDQPFTVFEGYTTHLFELINAKNVMSGKGSGKTWGKASWESVVEADPEYILVIDYGVSIRNTDDFDQKVEKIKSNPALKNIAAVKNNNFIRVKLSEITPGVRSVDSLERLSETINGK